MSHKKRVADAIDAVCERHAESLAALVDEPAPSPQPEMPEGWNQWQAAYDVWRAGFSDDFFKVQRYDMRSVFAAAWGLAQAHFRALLATQGLHIIDAQQKAVLDACAEAELVVHRYDPGNEVCPVSASFGRGSDRVALAELARRRK